MKVALVYDRVNKWGGAERILLALHSLFPEAPLYTSVYNPQKAPWASVFDIRTSFLQSLPLASSYHELYPFLMPVAFESFSFDNFDVVISVTSEGAKGILTKPGVMHICYCLTPTRYLWSGYEDYFQNPIFRFLAKPAVSYLRMWDKVASQRPDFYIAISKEVQKRIKKYYGRESEIVYPPVTLMEARGPVRSSFPATARSSLASSNELRGVGSPPASATPRFKKNYFLIVSRLVSYKRIDIAVKACNKLKLPLVIVGIGSEQKRLKRMAGPTITFLGSLTDEELVEYYRGCRALLFPGIEDLGLTILEAASLGKPTIAFRSGGSLETIVDGKTGVFFSPQTPKALMDSLKAFKDTDFDSKECIKQAKKFSTGVFKEQFLNLIKRLVE